MSTSASAAFSPDRKYRYGLWRRWDAGQEVTFVMLNPSTADERADDPTIRRCKSFARSWGFGGLRVANLFGWRATKWAELKTVDDPVGPGNDEAIFDACRSTPLTICAWGTKGELFGRAGEVLEIVRLARRVPFCLRLTQEGHPWHPLYVKGDAEPIRMDA
jgi:hypothetical protein